MEGLERLTAASKTDSYKATHWPQYPPGTNKVYSYFESRGGKFDETVFFGLKMILDKHFVGKVITEADVEMEAEFWKQHLGDPSLFNKAGWLHIVKDHGGLLPLRITAVPEGSVVPVSNVLMTVENTCPQCYWLTNWAETILVQTWYPSTVATISRESKKLILNALKKTGDPAGIDFKLHDFGFRGCTCVEQAGIGGAAHLLNFMGTDTVPGIKYAMKYYGAPVCGFSIAAAEHSTITSWGRSAELQAYENMLDKFPTGLVAVVSDSYNIFDACEKLWGGVLKDKVLGRKGTVVIRPDSGDPASTLKQVLDILGNKFGFTLNDKGARVLPPQVRVIYGDGINVDSIHSILFTVSELGGWSADNFAFGMGAGLLQKCDRDTQEHAFKASYIEVKGEGRNVWKDPVGRSSVSKKSKKGRLKLIDVNGKFETVPVHQHGQDQLMEVFLNGKLSNEAHLTWSKIRERAKLS